MLDRLYNVFTSLRLTVALPYKNGHLLGGPTIHLFIDLKSLGSFATF